MARSHQRILLRKDFEQFQTTHVIIFVVFQFAFKYIYVGVRVFTKYFLKYLKNFSYKSHIVVYYDIS